jgi:GTP diphosphokinase / guanosine-3',5'-bis(diphosphate) 3'-diphosphatase
LAGPRSHDVFDDGVERALRAAESAHRGQLRKGTDLPYVLHPIHVAMLLARLGYPPRVIQAALLHDVVEDGKKNGWNSRRVEREFGPAVSGIVGELTEDKRLSWETRKRRGIEHVAHMSADALAVKAADKLHNLRTLAADLAAARDRSKVWARFNAKPERSLLMSRALVDALARRVDPRLRKALRAAMADVERLGRA